MRFVDIYTTDLVPVGFDFIQTGEVRLTRTANLKKFTMADGALTAYPSDKDAASAQITLECSTAQSAALSKAVRLGELLLAGLNFGTGQEDALPAVSAVCGCLTGAVQHEQKSKRADICAVQIPVQIAVNDGGALMNYSVPAIHVQQFLIGGNSELLDRDYRYTPGYFARRSLIGTDEETLPVSISASVYGGASISGTVTQNGTEIASGGSSFTLSPVLETGENQFVIRFTAENCKPLELRFVIIRGAAWLTTKDGEWLFNSGGQAMTANGVNGNDPV